MDPISYGVAAKQKQRIEKVIAEPDSTSGLVNLPTVIAAGESITIPAGRVVVHPNLQVDGELTIAGELFVPTGGTVGLDTVDVSVLKQGGQDVANVATTVAKDSPTGAAYIPVGTTAQRPTTPSNGYLRYNIDLVSMEAYSNGAWGSVGGGATGGGTDHIFNLNGQVINSNYTIPTGMNAVTAGDVTIATGVTVTVPTGSKWLIV